MQSVNERPEHPARLFSLLLESLLIRAGLLAAQLKAEMLLACRAMCFCQPGPVSLLKAGGFITCLEVKLLFPRWPMGNFA